MKSRCRPSIQRKFQLLGWHYDHKTMTECHIRISAQRWENAFKWWSVHCLSFWSNLLSDSHQKGQVKFRFTFFACAILNFKQIEFNSFAYIFCVCVFPLFYEKVFRGLTWSKQTNMLWDALRYLRTLFTDHVHLQLAHSTSSWQTHHFLWDSSERTRALFFSAKVLSIEDFYWITWDSASIAKLFLHFSAFHFSKQNWTNTRRKNFCANVSSQITLIVHNVELVPHATFSCTNRKSNTAMTYIIQCK